MGKASPYPVARGSVFALCQPSVVGPVLRPEGPQRPSVAVFRVLGTPYAGLLFAFSAPAFVGSRSSRVRTQTEPSQGERRSCLQAQPRDVQGYAQWGDVA